MLRNTVGENHSIVFMAGVFHSKTQRGYYFMKIIGFLALVAGFAVSGCGGGGTSTMGSNAISSTVWRSPTQPTFGIVVSETPTKMVIVQDIIASADVNLNDETVWIAEQHSLASNSSRYAVEATKPSQIPTGILTYNGFARISTVRPDFVSTGTSYGKTNTTLQGPAQLIVNPNQNIGTLSASFSGSINVAESFTSSLNISIDNIQNDGYMTGAGSYTSSSGSDYGGTSVFVGTLAGPNAEEFVGIVSGGNHSGQLIGSR